MDIHSITVDQLDRLGVDQFGHLYWDGPQVQTVLSLPWWVNVAALIAAVATVVNLTWNIYKEIAPMWGWWPWHRR